MSECHSHEPCPECRKMGRDRSGDNLGVWDDHKYCFSCGHWEPLHRQFHSVELPKEQQKQDVRDLPRDFSCDTLRPDSRAWIKQYGITDEEIQKNHIGWSNEKEMLIFPILNQDGSLGMWQGRYFGPNTDHPKYLTRGYKRDLYHFLGSGQPLVLVEDLVSAIKVARVTTSMPLFGSDLSREQALVIARYYQDVAFWLDPDKKLAGMKFANRYAPLFNTKAIVSEKDPKYYSTVEIERYVR